MAFEFKLPDIGEGVHEGEILKWLVSEGDTVKEDQPLVEIMTDKVNAAIPSPRPGKILKRIGKEGEVIRVGAVLVVIGDAGESAPAGGSTAAPAPAPSAQEAATPQRAATPVQGAPAAAVGKALATPAVRKLARERGVDIDRIQGTGAGGRVTEADVKAATSEARAPAATSPAPAAAAVVVPARVAPPAAVPTTIPPGQREERVPLRGLRKRISEHMTEAHLHAAPFTYVEDCDMSEIVSLRERAKKVAEAKGVRLTYLPFIVKAVTHALKDHPYLNASLDEARGEIVIKKFYNIGIAANTDQGLIVPVVHDADKMTILELARDIEALAERARTNKLSLSDVQGSTFTITSVGKLGGVMSTPIVNYPEVAILGVNKLEKRAVVREDKVVARDMMNLSISLDHRVVDGYVGAVFLADVIKYLEDPNHFLL